MPKVFSNDERALILKWANEGLSYSDIGKKLVQDFPANWKSVKNPERAIGRIIKQVHKEEIKVEQVISSFKTLDEMTREERHDFISKKLKSTPRFRLTFRNFEEAEKDLFIEEYLSVIRSTDTITEAEEQSLFAGVLELVLALQALNRKEQQERWYEQTKNGEFDETDARYTPHLNNAEKYGREYDNHMKLYQKTMEQLKMDRRQRLKQTSTERKSLVDLAEELSSKSARSEAAEEIERLSRLRDEELKTMIENNYLLGKFEE